MQNNKINILHLSDLHFGEGIAVDDDNKLKIECIKSRRVEQFIKCINNIPNKPDYVVVSGDFTNIVDKNVSKTGFIEFNKVVSDLIVKNKLPDLKHFIVVPGNHDTDRNNGKGLSLFLDMIGRRYPSPWIPEYDKRLNLEDYIKMVATNLDDDSLILYGSIISTQAGNVCTPFILDMDKEILFYAFNSSSLVEMDMMLPKNSDALKQMVELPRINPEELLLFTEIITMMKNKLSSRYDDLIKVAVLHHHVAPISTFDEYKMFEMLMNSGKFKKYLQDAGYHIILHGHKHWPEVFQDSAIAGGGAHLVISGGTIGGNAARGKSEGFYTMEIEKTDCGNYATIHYYGLIDNDNYLNPLKMLNVVKMSIPQPKKIYGALLDGNETQRLNLKKLYSITSDAMSSHLRYIENRTGWSHNLTENEVATIATGFGLRIMKLINSYDNKFTLAYDNIIKTLLEFRKKAGGWTSRSGVNHRSIEAASWMLESFKCFNEKKLVETTLDEVLETIKVANKAMSINEHDVFYHDTYSISLVINALSNLSNCNEIVNKLRGKLLDAAIRDNDNNILYWSRKNNHGTNEQGRCKPSIIHTAHAIISLIKEREDIAPSLFNLNKPVEWLLSQQKKWNDEDKEEVYRGKSKLTIDHYTEPWVVVALLKAGVPVDNKEILESIGRIYNSHRNGLWPWGDIGEYPVWATYDALT